ncbi:MAG TPA: C1 family peptidase [Roseimicrobium sp.]|nr:C1 family peptidase [Roseimicrobium sp.]
MLVEELPADRKATVTAYPVLAAPDAAIPASFDGRSYWIDANGNSCLTPAWEQANTDFCWAFSSSTSASDRYRIANKSTPTGPFFETATYPGYTSSGWNGTTQTVLNGFEPMATGECSIPGATLGCSQTGNPIEGFDFLLKHGGPLLNEWGQYTCAGSCPNLSGVSLYTVGQPYHVTPYETPWKKSNERLIQKEILANGPVCTYIRMAPQLVPWWKTAASATEVFGPDDTGGKKYNRPDNHQELGGHLVVIVGWGTQNGEDYWLIRNSWGQVYGDKGYFMLHRGDNFICCEQSVAAVTPGTDVPVWG